MRRKTLSPQPPTLKSVYTEGVRWALIVPLAVGLLFAQQSAQKSGAKQPASTKPAPATTTSSTSTTTEPKSTEQKEEEPKPLFGGALDVKSSSDRKESATLGFKGIDPSGKVDKQMMATQVTAADEAKLKALAAAKPTPVQLAAFLKEGKLPAKGEVAK